MSHDWIHISLIGTHNITASMFAELSCMFKPDLCITVELGHSYIRILTKTVCIYVYSMSVISPANRGPQSISDHSSGGHQDLTDLSSTH